MKIKPALPVKESRIQVGYSLLPGITYWEVLSHPEMKDREEAW